MQRSTRSADFLLAVLCKSEGIEAGVFGSQGGLAGGGLTGVQVFAETED